MRFNHLPDVKIPDSPSGASTLSRTSTFPKPNHLRDCYMNMSGLAGSDHTDAGTVDVAGPQPGCSARAVASRGWMLRKDVEEEIAASREYQNLNPPRDHPGKFTVIYNK
jgi:hypothetical protein